MKLIGLAGYARCGKDYLAAQLGWPRAAFADCLKRDVAQLLGLSREELEQRKGDFRPLLVAYGAARRMLDNDYWIDRLAWNVNQCVVTDVRYLNEGLWVRSHGGAVVYVERDGVGPANDEEARSLQILRDGCPHYVIHNDGDAGVEALRYIAAQEPEW